MSKKGNVFDVAKQKIEKELQKSIDFQSNPARYTTEKGKKIVSELSHRHSGMIEAYGIALDVLGDLHHAWCAEAQKTVKKQCENQCKFGYTEKGWQDLIFCDSIKAGYGHFRNETCLFQIKPPPSIRHIRNQESCTHFEKAEKLLEPQKP